MRVFYGISSGQAQHHCRGDGSQVGGCLCIGIGRVFVDRAVVAQIWRQSLGTLSKAPFGGPMRLNAPMTMSARKICRELEEARCEASLATRRYEVVDPTKRLFARKPEARRLSASLKSRSALPVTIAPRIADRAALIALARDLPAAWNAPGTDRGQNSGSPTS